MGVKKSIEIAKILREVLPPDDEETLPKEAPEEDEVDDIDSEERG
jgi:hypothetical protein